MLSPENIYFSYFIFLFSSMLDRRIILSVYLLSLTMAGNFCHSLRIPLNLLFAFGMKHQMDISHGIQVA